MEALERSLSGMSNLLHSIQVCRPIHHEADTGVPLRDPTTGVISVMIFDVIVDLGGENGQVTVGHTALRAVAAVFPVTRWTLTTPATALHLHHLRHNRGKALPAADTLRTCHSSHIIKVLRSSHLTLVISHRSADGRIQSRGKEVVVGVVMASMTIVGLGMITHVDLPHLRHHATEVTALHHEIFEDGNLFAKFFVFSWHRSPSPPVCVLLLACASGPCHDGFGLYR